MTLRIGLVANPYAGVGGPAALKGSDGEETVALAKSLGSISKVTERVLVCLKAIAPLREKFEMLTVAGAMGEDACKGAGIPHRIVYRPEQTMTRAEHTKKAVVALQQEKVDLVLFAGGDGTARDVFDVLESRQVALGIPCGVKMHSGVFANNPGAAAKVLIEMIEGRLVTVMQGEVRDIDERSFREGVVHTRFYGEMWVPCELQYLQQVKSGGKESEALATQEIASAVIDVMENGVSYFIGSGSTTTAINETLGLPSTLLGVDVIRDQQIVLNDATEAQLYEIAAGGPSHIVVTAIGGQGHIFGRGNQQFSARVIRAVGLENLTVIATKTKLEGLAGKPLLVDTGDAALDELLAGPVRVVTGYDDSVLYPVAC